MKSSGIWMIVIVLLLGYGASRLLGDSASCCPKCRSRSGSCRCGPGSHGCGKCSKCNRN